jgi:hypothetical protein
LRKSKSLASEKGKGLGSGLCYEQRRDELGLYCAGSDLILILTLKGLHVKYAVERETLKHKVLLNDISKSSSYLTAKMYVYLHKEDQPVNGV